MTDTRSLPELFAQVRRFIQREHEAADAAGEDCDGANMAETALDEIEERAERVEADRAELLRQIVMASDRLGDVADVYRGFTAARGRR